RRAFRGDHGDRGLVAGAAGLFDPYRGGRDLRRGLLPRMAFRAPRTQTGAEQGQARPPGRAVAPQAGAPVAFPDRGGGMGGDGARLGTPVGGALSCPDRDGRLRRSDLDRDRPLVLDLEDTLVARDLG